MKESNIHIIGLEPEHPVYEPVGNCITVEEQVGAAVTPGGIIKPDRVKDREKADRLRVVALGEGREAADGRVIPITRCAVGDYVLVIHQAPFPTPVPGRPGQYIVDMVNVVGVSRQTTRH